MIDELTVYENIELPLIYNGVSSSERKKRVEEIMEKISIAHRAKHYPQQLSGGQQQRAAVASEHARRRVGRHFQAREPRVGRGELGRRYDADGVAADVERRQVCCVGPERQVHEAIVRQLYVA